MAELARFRRLTRFALGITLFTLTLVAPAATASPDSVTEAVLLTIEVTPIDPIVAADGARQFIATGLFSDGSTQDLTATVHWASSDHGVAKVSNAASSRGLATGVAAGTTEIRARAGAVEGSTTLTVSEAEAEAELVAIEVTPIDPIVAADHARQFTAIGLFSDGSTQDLTATVHWESSDHGVAKVSNAARSRGLATGVAAGTTEILARAGDIEGSTTLTVTDAVLVTIPN
jgi:hypothetical protein